MDQKITIDSEMAKTLVDIMSSKSSTDIEFATNIIINRDVNNAESEKEFIEHFLKDMISKENLFNEYSTVIKFNGKIMPIKGRSLFINHSEAKKKLYSY